MHEEPFRWAEAIANRREYIEHQLSGGSPVVAVSYDAGILLLTFSRDRRKIFEIYDALAMGAIGHPGDIERLRMAAIEVASTEGFVRSAQDVSLRRMAHYSLSPVLKAAFEQVYGAPFLARLLFAELGRNGAPDLFLRLDFDGAIRASDSGLGAARETFGVLGASDASSAAGARWLRENLPATRNLAAALAAACDAWAAASLLASEPADAALPEAAALRSHLEQQEATSTLEVMLIERGVPSHFACRLLEKVSWRKCGSRPSLLP